MIAFLKFMIKCLWEGSGYLFCAYPAVESEKPFDFIGIGGCGIILISFALFYFFIVKSQSPFFRIATSVLISFLIFTVYFLLMFLIIR